METFLIKALQLILSLSILVVIHEFGHFLFARIFKIRVEKFYLFFNPWFSLFKFKPKNSETEYGIGWLPLGGYVKIAGMIDESMDKEQMAKPAQPWEFRSKPAWQRFLVMFGGVLFNFILAMFIFSMMLFAWGDTYLPLKNVKRGMYYSESVKSAGFQDGDKLVSADGKELLFRGGILDMNTTMQFVDAHSVVVERDGKEVTIVLPSDFGTNVISSRQQPYDFLSGTRIDSLMADGQAAKHGIKAGDSITSFNNMAVNSYQGFRKELVALSKEVKSGEQRMTPISYYRGSELINDTIAIDSAAVIGAYFKNRPFTKDDMVCDQYSFFQSFPKGISMGVNTLKAYVSQMRFVFTKEGAKGVGGFAAIGNMFPAQWDWSTFWTMTAFLSIVLAFMNILPIPALDGGHIMFLLYEMITRRAPNEKFMEYAQMVGMFLLLGLLIFANGNDIYRAIFG